MKSIGPVLAMLAISGALLGYSGSLFLPHHYVAHAELAFPDTLRARQLFDSATEATLAPKSVEAMIRQSPYFKERLYMASAAEVTADLRTRVGIKRISSNGDLSGARIEVEDDDAAAALDIARVALGELGENAARAAGAKEATEVVMVVAAPQVGMTGLTPRLLAAGGLAAGLFAAFIIRIVLGQTIL